MVKLKPYLEIPNKTEIKASVLEYLVQIRDNIGPHETDLYISTSKQVSKFLESAESADDYSRRDFAVRLATENWSGPILFSQSKYMDCIQSYYDYLKASPVIT